MWPPPSSTVFPTLRRLGPLGTINPSKLPLHPRRYKDVTGTINPPTYTGPKRDGMGWAYTLNSSPEGSLYLGDSKGNVKGVYVHFSPRDGEVPKKRLTSTFPMRAGPAKSWTGVSPVVLRRFDRSLTKNRFPPDSLRSERRFKTRTLFSQSGKTGLCILSDIIYRGLLQPPWKGRDAWFQYSLSNFVS